ncbi:MAG: DsrE family protein [Candidatus Nanopelagicales bacterium]
MNPSLVVKLTWGAESPERVSQALSVATTALALGGDVSLWLAGEASSLAQPGVLEQVELEFAPPLVTLLNALLHAEAVNVCAQCAARRGITADSLLSGSRIAGTATFVEQVLRPDARVLVY